MEDESLRECVARFGKGKWEEIANAFPTNRTSSSIQNRWYRINLATATIAAQKTGAQSIHYLCS
jgi:hypothetical protein